MTTAVERFWAKVDKDGPIPEGQPELGPCWIWTASFYGRGYGHFYAGDGRFAPAHRFAWELEHGPIPAGLYVLHRCDVRACVRHDHLFAGTQQENILDARSKGRMIDPPRLAGTANPKAKITYENAEEMRRLYAAGVLQTELCARFGLSQGVVSKIVRGVLWRTPA